MRLAAFVALTVFLAQKSFNWICEDAGSKISCQPRAVMEFTIPSAERSKSAHGLMGESFVASLARDESWERLHAGAGRKRAGWRMDLPLSKPESSVLPWSRNLALDASLASNPLDPPSPDWPKLDNFKIVDNGQLASKSELNCPIFGRYDFNFSMSPLSYLSSLAGWSCSWRDGSSQLMNGEGSWGGSEKLALLWRRSSSRARSTEQNKELDNWNFNAGLDRYNWVHKKLKKWHVFLLGYLIEWQNITWLPKWLFFREFYS